MYFYRHYGEGAIGIFPVICTLFMLSLSRLVSSTISCYTSLNCPLLKKLYANLPLFLYIIFLIY